MIYLVTMEKICRTVIEVESTGKEQALKDAMTALLYAGTMANWKEGDAYAKDVDELDR